MNEIDKMRNSQLADMEKPEIQASFIYAKKTSGPITDDEYIR